MNKVEIFRGMKAQELKKERRREVRKNEPLQRGRNTYANVIAIGSVVYFYSEGRE